MTKDTMPSFGMWLRQLRAQLDLTQEQCAEWVGCSIESIRAFELGRRRPSRSMAERLADVLQVPSADRAAFMRLARTSAASAQPPITHEPPAARQAASARRFPVPPTALIGRAAEQADLRQRLQDPATRLVTLVGAGGSGKTRLAIQVGADLVDQFVDGTAFVNLTPVAAAEHVPAAIADILGMTLPSGQPPETALADALRERDLLLVLDNLEHLLDAVPLFATLMQETTGVRMLVTSRERLRVQGEQVIALDGLVLPADDANRAAVERSDAVLLFLARARRVVGDFALTPANRAAVAHICRLLGGMPLAIELAASWLPVLSPEEIIVELTRDLDFLALSDRTADPRHRSMRAVFEHSWRLLTEGERRVLARLSVFAGGCGREAAQQVSGATLPVLAGLIDKSLLRRTPAGRYELHELVRQFAAQQLAVDAHAVAEVRDRHCDYYSAWIHQQDSILRSPRQQEAFRAITAEIDNMRAAWHHAVDQRRIAALWNMVQNSALLWFYELRSWYEEGEMLCRRVLAMFDARPPENHVEQMLLGTMTGLSGWFAFRRGNPTQGIPLLEASLDMLRAGDQPMLLFFTLLQLSYLIYFNGEFERAVSLLDESLEVVRSIDDPWVQAHAAFQRAVLFVEHAPEVAYARFHEGMARIRAGGDGYHIVITLAYLGEVALSLGKVDEAERSFSEALKLSSVVSNGVGEVAALNGLALVANSRGDWREAIRRSMEAVARSREVGDMWGRAKVLETLAQAEAGAGDPVAARRTFTEALRVSRAAHLLTTTLDAAIGLAALDAHDSPPTTELLTIVALVRNHSALRRPAAVRAAALWELLAAQVDAQTVAAAEQAARSVAPNEVGSRLSDYALGSR